MRSDEAKKKDIIDVLGILGRLDPVSKEKLLSYGQGMADAIERMTATHRQT